MAEAAYASETKWLHDCIAWYADIFISMEARQQMVDLGKTYPDILHLLMTAIVIFSEREDVGWRWVVQGEDCDGAMLQLILEVESNVIRIDVIEVARA